MGQMVALYGKLEPSRSSAGKFKMIQPQFEILPAHGDSDAEFSMLEVGRIVPVYESLGGTTAWGAKLGSKWLRTGDLDLFEELEKQRAASRRRGRLKGRSWRPCRSAAPETEVSESAGGVEGRAFS